jgi:CDP-6-deoxy-D-xylo-4-hexulose-3-dehydrase
LIAFKEIADILPIMSLPPEVVSSVSAAVKESFQTASKHPKYWYPLATPTFGSDEILEALESMVSFKTTMWDKTRQFEEEFGQRYAAEAVMVNSGSSADLLLMFGMNKKSGGPLSDGDVVLVPAVTWPTQIWSIMMAGFIPRLVDVNPKTMNVDIEDLKSKISKDVKALFLVHLMGNPADMGAIQEICQVNDLYLLEDCCESIDAKYGDEFVGNFGVGASFSFFFSHHITTMEGGMILTKDPEFAHRMRLLRAHGWARHIATTEEIEMGIDPRYTFVNWGFNVRPTELQAGFGIHQIRKLSEFNDLRNRNAAKLQEVFSKHAHHFSVMEVTKNSSCSWFAFPVLINKTAPFAREDLTAYFEKNGVETRPVVAGNMARQPGFKALIQDEVLGLPGADLIHETGFYIGIHPIDYQDEISKLEQILEEFLTRY